MVTEKIQPIVLTQKQPQVSIGMPVYNGELFIREALDSLLLQTFRDFELIISDNASTDSTEKICREYAAKDTRIRYVRQTENRGAVANFKFVLDEATGEYFMWAAADDRWHPEWINQLLPMVISRSCLAYGRLRIIDENGHRIDHPANARGFEYTGSFINRRMKYFFEPSFLGKANPIYGLFERKALTDEKFKILAWPTYGTDMLFLFKFLHDMEIRANLNVYLEKRMHVASTAGFGFSEVDKYSVFIELIRSVFGQAKHKLRDVADYSRLCVGAERLIIFFVFPFAVLWDLGFRVSFKLGLIKKIF